MFPREMLDSVPQGEKLSLYSQTKSCQQTGHTFFPPRSPSGWEAASVLCPAAPSLCSQPTACGHLPREPLGNILSRRVSRWAVLMKGGHRAQEEGFTALKLL